MLFLYGRTIALGRESGGRQYIREQGKAGRQGGRVQGQAGYMNASRLFGVAEIDCEVGGGRSGSRHAITVLALEDEQRSTAQRNTQAGPRHYFSLVASLWRFISWGWGR